MKETPGKLIAVRYRDAGDIITVGLVRPPLKGSIPTHVLSANFHGVSVKLSWLGKNIRSMCAPDRESAEKNLCCVQADARVI
jgi:hypothetical protein